MGEFECVTLAVVQAEWTMVTVAGAPVGILLWVLPALPKRLRKLSRVDFMETTRMSVEVARFRQPNAFGFLGAFGRRRAG